jgi:hypothetical protein
MGFAEPPVRVKSAKGFFSNKGNVTKKKKWQ